MALAAGFGSVRRFNALFRQRYRLQPSQLRRLPTSRHQDSLDFQLAYRPPLDWPRLLAFLGQRAIAGVEAVDDGVYRRTVALSRQGQALRGWLAADGIKVSVVCPGFVRTRMTDNNPYPMPLIIDPDKAARIIRRGLERNKARIVFPWPMHLAALLLAVLPPAWTDPLLTRAPKKD